MQIKKRSILVFVSIGMIVGIMLTTIILIQFKQSEQSPETTPPLPSQKTDTAMDRLFQVSTKEGRTEWKLEAASAQMDQTENIAELKDVSIVFYPKSGGEVSIVADRGIIHTDSKDIEVSGHVVIVNENYKMVTEKLTYKEGSQILKSPTPLVISDDASSLTADRMVYNMGKNKSVLNGNVVGIFNANKIL